MGIQVLRVNKPKTATFVDCRKPSTGSQHAAGNGAGTPADRPAAATAAPRRQRSTCLMVIHNRPMLTRAYKIFGLRHGTMMIAIHDLMWSVFVVFLLVLAAAHVREVSHMVESDILSRLGDRLGPGPRDHHHPDHGRGHEHAGLEHLGKGHPDFEQHQSIEHAVLQQIAKELGGVEESVGQPPTPPSEGRAAGGRAGEHHDGEHHAGEHHDGEHHDGEHHDGEHHDGEHHDGEHYDGEHHDGEHHDGEHHDGEHHDGEHYDGEHSSVSAHRLAKRHARQLPEPTGEDHAEAQAAVLAVQAVEAVEHEWDPANLTRAEQDSKKAPRKCLNSSSSYMHYVEFAYNQAKSIINLEAANNNESRLNEGAHLATMLSVVMVIGICVAGIDMIASMMLLAGALLNVRQLMMPWLSLRLMELIVLLGSTFISMIFWAKGVVFCKILFLDFIIVCEFVVIFYHWLVAFSLHEQLCRMERTGGLVHHTSRAPTPAAAVPCKWCAIRTGVRGQVHDKARCGVDLTTTTTIDMSTVGWTERVAGVFHDDPREGAADPDNPPALTSA